MHLRTSLRQFRIHEPERSDRGQVLVVFSLFLVVLAGFAAVTIDYGSWLKARRDYQNVADSAALAGSAFLVRPITNAPSDPERIAARRAAWDSINKQLGLSLAAATLSNTNTAAGFPVTSGANGYSIWVSTPPITAGSDYPGAYIASNDRTLFVQIRHDNPAYFSRIFGQGDRTISAWATAGSFPSRYAVITLRQQGQGPASAPQDILLAGTNSALDVSNGDVGGNWGMKLNSSAQLWIHDSNNGPDADVYLVDNVSCGNSCWSANQVNTGFPSYTLKAPLLLPNIIEDPNYPLPTALSSLPSSGGTSLVPKASGTDASGNITITNNLGTQVPGTTTAGGASTTCDTTTSAKIGPGWYHDINVGNGSCLILDPVNNHSSPNNPGTTDVVTLLGSGQQPGIFYVTGTLNVNGGSLVVGDGVTLVFFPSTSNSDGLVDNGVVEINRGLTGVNRAKGAFLSDGSYTYTYSTKWTYTADNNDKTRFGVAVYVAKPSQIGNATVDANTSLIKVNSTGAALAWSGLTYAPHDNVQIAGQPNHDGVGQLVSWTVKFAGGTTVHQTYDGPDGQTPRLLEPTLGQ